MKEGVAAAIGVEPAAQVAPALDLVNRFVLDQALEHQRGRPPVDAPEDQESPIEPRPEQVDEVGIDADAFGMAGQRPEKVPADVDEHRGAAPAPC